MPDIRLIQIVIRCSEMQTVYYEVDGDKIMREVDMPIIEEGGAIIEWIKANVRPVEISPDPTPDNIQPPPEAGIEAQWADDAPVAEPKPPKKKAKKPAKVKEKN